MSEKVILAWIDLLKVAIPSAIGLVGLWFSYRAATHSKDTLAVSNKIQEQTNGLTEKLINTTSEASEAKGNLAGRAEQRIEDRKQA